ncbi:hypothetical protein [Nocardia sp. NPDC020380]|uniref:hypothetical protein n=1 Tax=Nocardia sp. NPDC020380 TaxID=3364309 RepID=UPI003793AF0A
MERRGRAERCDCPVCGGFDLDATVAEIDLAAAEFGAATDAFDAELLVASFLSIGVELSPGVGRAFAESLVARFETRGDAAGLGMLRALGVLTAGPVARACARAADRLTALGVSAPDWAGELTEPVAAGDFLVLTDSQAPRCLLYGTFRRAGREHGFLLSVDDLDCGAVQEILPLGEEELAGALGMAHELCPSSSEAIAPDDFRLRAVRALYARALHDAQLAALGLEDDDYGDSADGMPPYGAAALVLQTRLSGLSASKLPMLPHGRHCEILGKVVAPLLGCVAGS